MGQRSTPSPIRHGDDRPIAGRQRSSPGAPAGRPAAPPSSSAPQPHPPATPDPAVRNPVPSLPRLPRRPPTWLCRFHPFRNHSPCRRRTGVGSWAGAHRSPWALDAWPCVVTDQGALFDCGPSSQAPACRRHRRDSGGDHRVGQRSRRTVVWPEPRPTRDAATKLIVLNDAGGAPRDCPGSAATAQNSALRPDRLVVLAETIPGSCRGELRRRDAADLHV